MLSFQTGQAFSFHHRHCSNAESCEEPVSQSLAGPLTLATLPGIRLIEPAAEEI